MVLVQICYSTATVLRNLSSLSIPSLSHVLFVFAVGDCWVISHGRCLECAPNCHHVKCSDLGGRGEGGEAVGGGGGAVGGGEGRVLRW